MRRMWQLPRRLPDGSNLYGRRRKICSQSRRVRRVLNLLSSAERRRVLDAFRQSREEGSLPPAPAIHGSGRCLPDRRSDSARAGVSPEPPRGVQRSHGRSRWNRGGRPGHGGDQDQRCDRQAA